MTGPKIKKNPRPRSSWAISCSALIILCLACLAAAASAAEKSRHHQSDPQSNLKSDPQSNPQTDRPSDAAPALIEIKFADPRIPEIHVSGAAASDPTPYGVYLSEDEQAAHDHAAAMAPPPDPNLYALQWESHEGLDSQREGLAGEELAADHLGWGWNLPSDSDFYLFRPFFWRESARPTPPDAHATFNITEYNAALGEWRRAQERAARHETQKKVR